MKHLTQCSWDQVPHLAEAAKKELWDSLPAYQRDARTKGIPVLGSGAIYPYSEDDYVISDFEIPKHWPKAYGLDVGWNRTAALWGALNRDTDVLHIYSEHYRGEAEPVIHTSAIQARGKWIRGAIDPASRGRGQADGRQLLQLYRDLGLDLTEADNAVEAGIYQVAMRIGSGRLKIFRSCQNTLQEMRLYRRDEKGRVVKERDHLMDACFAADTPVLTSAGPVRIADLKDGLILSRGGCWARFCGARLTRRNVPVVRLGFSDGSTVTCTPDHLFLTPHGWLKAIEMQGQRCSNGIAQCIQTHYLTSTLSLRRLRNSTAGFITSAASTFSAALTSLRSACIVWSGQPLMAATYRLDTRYITGTATPPTTSPITSNWSRNLYTADITQNCGSLAKGARARRLWSLPKSGTRARADESGTQPTTSALKKSFISLPRMFASIVARHTKRQLSPPTDSVQGPASITPARLLVWTTRNVLARCAAELSLLIVTMAGRRARRSAAEQCTPEHLECVSVEPAGNGDVYCLTVPGIQAFCLGNGAVVHNCRYACMELHNIARTEPQPAPEPKPQYYSPGTFDTGWME